MATDLPQALLKSLEAVPGFDESAFRKLHASDETVTSVRFNPAKPLDSTGLETGAAVPWTSLGYYLRQRPSFTFDPLFHAGCYYVQEASSMFLEFAFKQCMEPGKAIRALDLSAAPGGKSTHLQSLLPAGSVLVSNEVLRPRARILEDNMIKWGGTNVLISNNDPADIGKLTGFFDLIVVDAPCSGSGLFRREPAAIDEWSEHNVRLCSQRQQRILADIYPALKPGGVLIYSTCSYSPMEDEDILDWLSLDFGFEPLPLEPAEDWSITTVQGKLGAFGYRFWPYQLGGEGFFLAAMRKANDGSQGDTFKARKKPTPLTSKEIDIVRPWVQAGEFRFIRYESTVYAWPELLYDDLNFLLNQLHVLYSGVRLGELKHDKLVPDHALALSNMINEEKTRVDLNRDQAIQYLQRKDIDQTFSGKGWQLVTYKQQELGWINVLPNRINNYYPRELRILKDRE